MCRQVFEAARRARFAGDDVELTHVPFGLVLGEDGYESSLLEFFSRVAKVEAALSDWGIIARAMQETGAGPPGMDETATKERLLWSAVSILRRHPDYWILKTTDPEGRPVAIQSEGWLFLFTSPDVALRHSLDAHESAEGLPAMEPHRFSSKMVRDHAHSAPAGELAGLFPSLWDLILPYKPSCGPPYQTRRWLADRGKQPRPGLLTQGGQGERKEPRPPLARRFHRLPPASR